MPTRLICCACAANGQETAAPPKQEIRARRSMESNSYYVICQNLKILNRFLEIAATDLPRCTRRSQAGRASARVLPTDPYDLGRHDGVLRHVGLWPKADMPPPCTYVRFRG